ncbi:DUF3772 domain-containing protein [Pseudorhodobacter sp.]|uniref:DUF3772 domain-containing protein n=1 Tax=Pseudorhodobacter sp. TaxID=1934400 RepID=UPI002648006E|nr:DUF3772 domain-containing protein [Pseudorhodobacter sp.]MDN5787213.1 DUF3772 domain-containing protein [Pseudorhodobacter sp.]
MRRTGKPTIALVLLWVWLAVLGFAAPIAAQTNFSTGAVPAAADAADSAPDYKVWEKFAAEVDDFIADPRTSDVRLETVRDEVATWRAKFLAAQGTNSARIGTLRTQIDALGPPPAEGATEADDIAVRRKALTEQLSVLQAPSISAVEAYSRADGLIREIDSLMRDRQADELLQLWPIPINPANWPAGVSALMKSMDDVEAEVRAALSNETRRAAFMDKLPPIIALLLFAAFTILRGRALIEGVTLRLQERSHSDAREISAFVASLGQIVVPSLGVFAFSTAIILSGMLGPLGEVVARTLIEFGLIVFTARWLGIRSFPRAASAPTFLHMSE